MDIDHNVPTFFRGNREFGTTLAGTRALLRRADGSLTRRGETYYQRPEVIVRIPAIQRGNSSRGEQYSINTHKVLTEHEYPEIGNLWRGTAGDDTAKARAVKAWVVAQFTGNLIMEESDQEWLYDNTRPFEFLVRRMVQNQLQVNRIPLNGTVLQYEFLDLKKPCEYQRGGQCVVQQCAICLRMSESDVEYYLDLAFGEVSHGAPFNGDDWRNVGVSTEMMEKFAEMLDIGLHVFHGKQKIFQRSASSHDSPSLTYYQWDGHAFFELCSKSQMKKLLVPRTPAVTASCVSRDRMTMHKSGRIMKPCKMALFTQMIFKVSASLGSMSMWFPRPNVEMLVSSLQSRVETVLCIKPPCFFMNYACLRRNLA